MNGFKVKMHKCYLLKPGFSAHSTCMGCIQSMFVFGICFTLNDEKLFFSLRHSTLSMSSDNQASLSMSSHSPSSISSHVITFSFVTSFLTCSSHLCLLFGHFPFIFMFKTSFGILPSFSLEKCLYHLITIWTLW